MVSTFLIYACVSDLTARLSSILYSMLKLREKNSDCHLFFNFMLILSLSIGSGFRVDVCTEQLSYLR